MIIMQRLSEQFEHESGIELEWVVLEENVLRHRVTTDIATESGQFDVITIGSYETPIWAKQGWLIGLDDLGESYDYDDLIDPVRDSLSVDGVLYAAPFYAESSMTYFRRDLFEQAGLTMPDQPTYEQIEHFASVLHDPEEGVYGICLRGKPGWGENMAFVGTLINTFGGRWFDMEWKPCLTSPEWHEAISFYVRILSEFGPPGSTSNGHNECRALFATGKCAIWIDATSAAGYIYNPAESQVADVTGFVRAPVAKVPNGSSWSWAWALAVPSSTKQEAAAKQFLAWATSKAYVRRVAESDGWTVAPPGTRMSTYDSPDYTAAAPFAESVKQAILAADPENPSALPVPYTGVQYVAIPEFQGIGLMVGKWVAAALAGQMSVDEALQTAQRETERTISRAGYGGDRP
jgi:ABC-type glycerol-3-phosphate transport system substrate-binding protein